MGPQRLLSLALEAALQHSHLCGAHRHTHAQTRLAAIPRQASERAREGRAEGKPLLDKRPHQLTHASSSCARPRFTNMLYIQ